jgi:hypothetical protein
MTGGLRAVRFAFRLVCGYIEGWMAAIKLGFSLRRMLLGTRPVAVLAPPSSLRHQVAGRPCFIARPRMWDHPRPRGASAFCHLPMHRRGGHFRRGSPRRGGAAVLRAPRFRRRPRAPTRSRRRGTPVVLPSSRRTARGVRLTHGSATARWYKPVYRRTLVDLNSLIHGRSSMS